MPAVQLTNRQAMVLCDSMQSHEPNVLHLSQERPYGPLTVELYSPYGHETVIVPDNYTDPVKRSREGGNVLGVSNETYDEWKRSQRERREAVTSRG